MPEVVLVTVLSGDKLVILGSIGHGNAVGLHLLMSVAGAAEPYISLRSGLLGSHTGSSLTGGQTDEADFSAGLLLELVSQSLCGILMEGYIHYELFALQVLSLGSSRLSVLLLVSAAAAACGDEGQRSKRSCYEGFEFFGKIHRLASPFLYLRISYCIVA